MGQKNVVEETKETLVQKGENEKCQQITDLLVLNFANYFQSENVPKLKFVLFEKSD